MCSLLEIYCKVPKFSDTRKLCCNLPKIQTKRQNLLIFWLKDANGIANSEDPDQTAPLAAVCSGSALANSEDPDQTAPLGADLGLHCLPKTVCPKTYYHCGKGLL